MTGGRRPRWLVPLLAVCMVVSGACGLVYEVVWARMLGVFLGASAHAHAMVLAGFLGGLALGNTLVGRLVDRRPASSLAVYALLEAAIGLYGFVSPELQRAVARGYDMVAGGAEPGDVLVVAKLVAAVVFVLLPTVAMGGTLPTLTRHVARELEDVGHTVARLYLLNTVGAAAGAFAAGMILVPRLGSVVSVRAAAAANLVVAVAALFAWALTRSPHVDGEDDEEPSAASEPPPPRALLVVAFLVGVASLTMEVAWTRVLAMVFGSSAQAFTLMLTTFIAGIALGSSGATFLLARWRGREAALLARLLAGASALLVVQIPFYEHLPYWQFVIAQALERRPAVYPLYLAAQSALSCAWMLPLTVVTGAALPVTVRAFTTRRASIGGSVGLLFTANTLGNVVGPILATFVLFPLAGLRHTVTFGVLALSAAAVVASRIGGTDRRRIAMLATVLALAAASLPGWDPSLMHAGGFRRWTLEPGSTFDEFRTTRMRSRALWSADGPVDSVVVLENRDGLRFMKVNGKTDASDAEDLPTQRMVGHLPVLLHRASRGEPGEDVFVVGLGSGVTVASVAMHEGVEVTAAEISGDVIRASRYFDHVNHEVHSLPNVAIHQADAREWLERSERRWDVIVNQPSNPWIAGNAALFSREFFVAARERLAEGGIFAQWMHVYAMDDATVDVVMNTFASVFPHVTVWWPQGVDLLLIGTVEPLVPDLDELERGLMQPWLQAEMGAYDREGVQISSLGRLLALQVQSEDGFHEAFPGTPPYTTDRRPVLEFRAPPAQFVGARSERFIEVDERLRPGLDTSLHIGRLGADELDLEDLLRLFAARDTPFSQRLAGSLEHAIVGAPTTAAEFRTTATRATGLPVLFEAWTETLAADPAPNVDECRAWLETAQTSLPIRASVFFRPDLGDVRRAVDACARPLSPAIAGFLRAMEAELLDACGYRTEARAMAEALLASPQAPAITESMRALLDDDR